MLVEFYNPDCPHCQRYKPEFDAAAVEMLKMNPPVPMGLVNIVKNFGVMKRYGVTGTPTVQFFYEGKKAEDHRGWDRDMIVANVRSWVQDALRNPR